MELQVCAILSHTHRCFVLRTSPLDLPTLEGGPCLLRAEEVELEHSRPAI